MPHPDGTGFALQTSDGTYVLAPGGGVAKFDTEAAAKSYSPEPPEYDDEDDEEDEDSHYTPQSWDEMSNDLQEQAFHKWKENTYQEFLDSEIHNWQENGGSYDEADLHPMGTCQTFSSWFRVLNKSCQLR